MAGSTGSTEKAYGRDWTGRCCKQATKLKLIVDEGTRGYPVLPSVSSYFHLLLVPKPCYNEFSMKIHKTGTDSVLD